MAQNFMFIIGYLLVFLHFTIIIKNLTAPFAYPSPQKVYSI